MVDQWTGGADGTFDGTFDGTWYMIYSLSFYIYINKNEKKTLFWTEYGLSPDWRRRWYGTFDGTFDGIFAFRGGE